MNTSYDSWLREQIEGYRVENAASEAFYHQAASLLSAHQLLTNGSVCRWRRLRSLSRRLCDTFRRLYRDDRRSSRESPAVLEGVVMRTPMETDLSAQTVIVIGVVEQTKGE